MSRKKRPVTPFSLSFLDIMSCGFGAVVLLFLIIKHQAEAFVPSPSPDLTSEVNMLEQQVTEGEKELVELRNTLAEIERQQVEAQGMARKIEESIDELRGEIETDDSEVQGEELEKLKAEVRRLEEQKRKLEKDLRESADDVRRFVGDGNREYLTGMKVGGERILILLDRSASMLDDEIVNIVRRRNMDDAAKRRSPKWRQALATVDWLTARLPLGSRYQLYAFNTGVEPVLPKTSGRWLQVGEREQLDEAVEAAKSLVPRDGTSLERAFQEVARLSPPPDNIYLITDGLPTQGMSPPRGNKVSGAERLRLFEDAVGRLPGNVPVNVILLPMEGDPMAASAMWQLAQMSAGSFLTPAGDWP